MKESVDAEVASINLIAFLIRPGIRANISPSITRTDDNPKKNFSITLLNFPLCSQKILSQDSLQL